MALSDIDRMDHYEGAGLLKVLKHRKRTGYYRQNLCFAAMIPLNVHVIARICQEEFKQMLSSF